MPIPHPIEQVFNLQVMYIDIVGFTELGTNQSPTETYELMRELFGNFTKLAEASNIRRVHTIGDCFVAIPRVKSSERNVSKVVAEASDMAQFGQRCIKIVEKISLKRTKQISVRLGIHTGTVIGCEVGRIESLYDIFGDDVLIANKIEQMGKP